MGVDYVSRSTQSTAQAVCPVRESWEILHRPPDHQNTEEIQSKNTLGQHSNIWAKYKGNTKQKYFCGNFEFEGKIQIIGQNTKEIQSKTYFGANFKFGGNISNMWAKYKGNIKQ